MERLAFRNVEHVREHVLQGEAMLTAIASFFRGLFGRKADNFKDLLIADLGIER
jgi:hypothetical protein